MKTFAPLALLALAAGVSAVDPKCEADYIVQVCKSQQKTRINSCTPSDWDCLCPAYQALRSCFNNCPKDPEIGSADGQVTIYCQYSSVYGSKKMVTMTATTTGATATAAAEATKTTTDGEVVAETATISTTATGVKTTMTGTTVVNSTASKPGATATGTPKHGSDKTGLIDGGEASAAALARNLGAVLLVVAGSVAAML